MGPDRLCSRELLLCNRQYNHQTLSTDQHPFLRSSRAVAWRRDAGTGRPSH